MLPPYPNPSTAPLIRSRASVRIAREVVESRFLRVEPGQVCGIIQDGVGYHEGRPAIVLHMEAYLGAPESYDSVQIEGRAAAPADAVIWVTTAAAPRWPAAAGLAGGEGEWGSSAGFFDYDRHAEHA